MLKLIIKYVGSSSVSVGGEQAAVAPSIRFKFEPSEPSLIKEFMTSLKENYIVYFTQTEPTYGMGVADVQARLQKEDPGYVQVYANKADWQKIGFMEILKSFCTKYKEVSLEIIKPLDGQLNREFYNLLKCHFVNEAKLLDSAKVDTQEQSMRFSF